MHAFNPDGCVQLADGARLQKRLATYQEMR
jgi:hypothetical protein